MFKSRSGSKGSTSIPPQSIDAVRRRARHRLIGASVLVLLGVIGFPLLFDTQPRPISVDVPIEIPAKNPAKPLTASKAPEADAKPAAKPAAAPKEEGTSLRAKDGLSPREEVVESPKPAAPAKAEPKPEPKAEPKVAAKTESAETSKAEAARAKALLEGKIEAKKTPSQSTASERVVVQVGAFAEASGARTVRMKLERAGLKTYTHEANTSEGKRIRVRLGPFDSRAEAEKAAAKVKALGLPAAILTL